MNSVKAAQSLQGLSKGKFTLFCCGNTQCRYSAIHVAPPNILMQCTRSTKHCIHSTASLPFHTSTKMSQSSSRFGTLFGNSWKSLHRHHHEEAPQQDPQIGPLYILFSME